MAIEGVDYSTARPDPGKLYAAGKRFACRYLYGTTVGKAVTRAEIDALHEAGLAVVLNWEWSASEAKGGWAAGVDRARRTWEIVTKLGAPASTVVYFSVDYDVTDMGPVREYFRGVTSVWPKARTGIYGGRRVIEAAKLQGWCPWYWQTYAWSGGVWVPGAHIQQYNNDEVVADGTVDLDRALVADYGQWRAEDDMPTAQEIAEAVWAKQILGGDKTTTYAASSFLRNALIGVQIDLPKLIAAVRADVAVVKSQLAALGQVDVDEAAIAADILRSLTPEAIAAAIPADLARQVADELARRLES